MNIVPKRANMERRRGAMDRGRVESLAPPPRPRLRPPAGSLGHGEADLAARGTEKKAPFLRLENALQQLDRG